MKKIKETRSARLMINLKPREMAELKDLADMYETSLSSLVYNALPLRSRSKGKVN